MRASVPASSGPGAPLCGSRAEVTDETLRHQLRAKRNRPQLDLLRKVISGSDGFLPSRLKGLAPLTKSQWLPSALIGSKPCVYSGTTELRTSLHGHGVDLIAADFQFDAVGRPQIASLHDGAAHQDVSGELLELNGIKDG